MYAQDQKVVQLQNLYQDLMLGQQQQLLLQNLAVQPQEIVAEAKNGAKSIAGNSMIAIDSKNLLPCSYATENALYNVGGIANGDLTKTQQTLVTLDFFTYTFNFCEEAITEIPAGCPEGDFTAYGTSGTGECFGLTSYNSTLS